MRKLLELYSKTDIVTPQHVKTRHKFLPNSSPLPSFFPNILSTLLSQNLLCKELFPLSLSSVNANCSTVDIVVMSSGLSSQ